MKQALAFYYARFPFVGTSAWSKTDACVEGPTVEL